MFKKIKLINVALFLVLPTLFTNFQQVDAAVFDWDCSRDIVFIGARGSGQGDSVSDPAHLGMGEQVYNVFSGFYDSAKIANLGDRVAYSPVEVGYTAISVPDGYADGGVSFNASIDRGISDLLTTVTTIGSSWDCPNPPTVVISGYSQGAEVVKRAYNSLSASNQGVIDGIMLLADPRFSLNDGSIKTGTSDKEFCLIIDGELKCGDGEGLRGPLNFDRKNFVYNTQIYSHCLEHDSVCDRHGWSVSGIQGIHTDNYQAYGYTLGQTLWNAIVSGVTYSSGSSGSGGTTTPPPASTPSVPTEELIFYRNSSGHRVYADLDKAGHPSELADGYWSKSWTHIVPIELDGDAQSEMLFYNSNDADRTTSARIYDATSASLAGPTATHNWSNGWEIIEPLQLDSDKTEELLLYSPTSGRYYFLDLYSDGRVKSTIKEGTWSKNWKMIKPVEFDGSTRHELIFYKEYTTNAIAYMYDLGSTAGITRKAEYTWSKGWTHIEPIDLTGDGTDEIIIYKAGNGSRQIRDLTASGYHNILSSGTWSTGWDIITAIEIDGTKGSELLFYDSDRTETRGYGSIYDMTSTNIGTKLNGVNWSKGWDFIMPAQLD